MLAEALSPGQVLVVWLVVFGFVLVALAGLLWARPSPNELEQASHRRLMAELARYGREEDRRVGHT